MNFKPTKRKIIFSLIPFYLLILMVPLLGLNDKFIFLGKIFGETLVFVAVMVYLSFLKLVVPFQHLFEKVGLFRIEGSGGLFPAPIISFWGLILLALIYFCLIYLVVSFFSKKV